MRGQRGVALLVVLWACTLLAILVGGFASIARTEALQTRYSLGQQRARYAAEAMLFQTIGVEAAHRERLPALGANAPAANGDMLPRDGRPVPLAFDDMKVVVSLLDETGKVDLNTADRPVLKALFLAAGTGEKRAATLAENIEEWRTVLGAPDSEGAARYAAAGLAYGPRHARFESLEELQAVLGMDGETFAAVEPAITVWSGRTRPLTDFAPVLAMAAFPGMDLAHAREVVAMRAQLPPGKPVPGLPPGVFLGGALPGNTMTIRADADDGHGMRARAEATVKFNINPGQPRDVHTPLYTILRWHDGPAT